MSILIALILKDLRLFFADRKAVIITFIVPIAIASFMGSITSGSASNDGPKNKIKVLVVDEDRSSVSEKIFKKLQDGELTKAEIVDRAAAEKAVKEGKAPLAVMLPKGFGKEASNAMFNGTPPKLELIYDPSKSLEMQAVQGVVMQAGMETVSQEAFSLKQDYSEQEAQIDTAEGLSPTQRQSFKELFQSLKKVNAGNAASGDSDRASIKQPFSLEAHALTKSKDSKEAKWSGMAHMFAGMAIQGIMFFAIDAAMNLLRDRRLGIWKRLLASPVTMFQLLLGKALGSALVASFVLSAILLFGMVIFGIRVTGSWLGLGMIIAASGLMVGAFGLLVASLGRTEAQSRGLSVFVVLIMSMLGGAWFPSFLMPAWMQSISLAIPVRWAVDGLDAMLWRGLGVSAAVPSVVALLVFSVVFGAVAFLRFRTIPESA